MYIDPHEVEGYCVICGREIMIDDWRGIVPEGMICEHCTDCYDEYEEDVPGWIDAGKEVE